MGPETTAHYRLQCAGVNGDGETRRRRDEETIKKNFELRKANCENLIYRIRVSEDQRAGYPVYQSCGYIHFALWNACASYMDYVDIFESLCHYVTVSFWYDALPTDILII